MIKAIAFDLDDTLIDTTGLLVPLATESSYQILKEAGLSLTYAETESLRIDIIKSQSHRDFYLKLGDHLPVLSNKIELIQKAIDNFYNPPIPSHLTLLEGALENLLHLKKKYKLFLVTAGLESGQNKKIEALHIRPFFEKIYIVDSHKKEKKQTAFENIITELKISAHELLCIGNSLSSEIYDARKIGAWACYFEFGEERTPYPQDPAWQPHFKVNHHHDLINACKI